MSIGHTLLGLLESGPRHGYDLKRAFDERFGHDRPLHYGQVYSTMSRLLKNGLVEVDGIEAAGGPERKRYAITEAGVKRTGELADQLICDHALFPLEGDLRWLELTTARPDRLVEAVAA